MLSGAVLHLVVRGYFDAYLEATMTAETVSTDAAVRELLAKQEIRDALMRYSRGVDRVDMEVMLSAYHPRANDNHGTYKGDAEGFARYLEPALRLDNGHMHFLGNSLIEIQGDRAASETYVIAYHRYPADENGIERDFFFGGRYLDVFEHRDEGGWRIVKRTVVPTWTRTSDATEDWPAVTAFAEAHEDRSDLVYHLLDD
jgi:hypothetical protein